MDLVVARFQYALAEIAGQIFVDDLNKIDAVFVKAFRWQFTSIVPSAANIAYSAYKHYSNMSLIPLISPMIS